MKTTLIKSFLAMLLFVGGSAPEETLAYELSKTEGDRTIREEPYEVRKLKLSIQNLQLQIGIAQRDIEKKMESK